MREAKRAGSTAEGGHAGNEKAGGKLGRDATGAAERRDWAPGEGGWGQRCSKA